MSGIRLDFTSQPQNPPREKVYQLSATEQLAWDQLVQELVDLGIVVECSDPAFISGLFVVPKPEGKFRLIIDLSDLNELLFQMYSLSSALEVLEQGYWMTSTDLEIRLPS